MQEIENIIKQFDISSGLSSVRKAYDSRYESFLADFDDGTTVLFQMLPYITGSGEKIMRNIAEITEYLKSAGMQNGADIIRFAKTRRGEYCHIDADGLWRGVYFNNRVHAPFDDDPSAVAYGLGRSIGLFHQRLNGMPTGRISPADPNLHDTPAIFSIFQDAVTSADQMLCGEIQQELGYAQRQQNMCSALIKMDLPFRIINNDVTSDRLLLDNESGEAIGLGSYDGVMAGAVAYDFGIGASDICYSGLDGSDTFRNAAFEPDLFREYTKGYISAAGDMLTSEELESLPLGMIVMPLEQGLKDLTAYIKNPADVSLRTNARRGLKLCNLAQLNYQTIRDIIKVTMGKVFSDTRDSE